MSTKTDGTWNTAFMTGHYRREYSALLDRKIVDIRAMYPEEMEILGWESAGEAGCLLILDDGSVFVPAQDPEGNGPGALIVSELD